MSSNNNGVDFGGGVSDDILNAIKNQLLNKSGKDVFENLSPVVKKRVDALKEIQTQHDELEAKFFEEKAALEAKYQKLYQPLYAKRHDIVNGVVDVEESISVENPTDEKGVPFFWLNAMNNNGVLAEEITERDEEALRFLKDIKWSRGDNPKVFNLEFCFETNPFFKNNVLTKTYEMVDEEDEPILKKATGTVIEWFPGKSLTVKIVKKRPKKGSKNANPITTERSESFFNFFSPPQVPEEGDEIDEDDAEELQNMLEHDFNIGSTIRDKIIPNAVSWFTGEAADDEYAYMEEDDDDEDEDDEDLDEDEEEDESKAKKKKGGRAPAVDGQEGERPPECKQQ